MTRPEDPSGEPDWGFPEVGAEPTSLGLPPEESAQASGDGPYDTGSDAWWRAQAAAQRVATEQDAPPPTPPAVPPPPAAPLTPLDPGWLPSLGEAPSGPPREAAAPVDVGLPLTAAAPPAPLEPPVPPAPTPPVAPAAPAPPPPPAFVPPAPSAAAVDPEIVPVRPELRPFTGRAAQAPPPPHAPRTLLPPVDAPFGAPVDPAPRAPALGPDDEGAGDATGEVPAYPSAGREELLPPYRDDSFLDAPLPVRDSGGGGRRGLLGAALAVAGVLLLVGALLLARGDLFGGKNDAGPALVVPPPQATTAPTLTATVVTTQVPSPQATTAPSIAPTAQSSAPAVASVAPRLPLLVLNNSKVSGLAARSADRFRSRGWSISGTGNYSGGTVAATTVYYAAGQRGSAERAAQELGIPRVKPRFAGLPGSGLTVVVTRDAA